MTSAAVLEEQSNFNRRFQHYFEASSVEIRKDKVVSPMLVAERHRKLADALDVAISALRADGEKCDQNATEIRPGCNTALTMEQLRKMDGQPVWAKLLEPTTGTKEGWALVYSDNGYAAVQRWTHFPLWYQEYGETWIAYAYPPTHIDREAWKPCERCKPKEKPLDRFIGHEFQIDGSEIYYHDTDDGWEGEEIKFCPWCGRPLTEEAWDELEKRLRGCGA